MDPEVGIAASQVSAAATALPPDPYDPAWNRIGQIAGYVGGSALFISIVLFLLDRLGILGSAPSYKSTDAGAVQDEATFYAAYFAHQHQILWDLALRDTLGPLGYLGAMVTGIAILNVVGPRRALAQLFVAAFVVGAIFTTIESLAFLGAVEYWRYTGWSADPAAKMLAIGRDTETIQTATSHMALAGYIAFAAGLLILGRLAQECGRLPSQMRYPAYAAAILLVLVVVTAEVQLDTAYNVLAILSALVFPAILIWLGRHFGQLGRARTLPA